jgi:hypothetical protein
VAAEIERVEKFARSHKVVREVLAGRRALGGAILECRYLAVDADGTVRRTSLGRLEEDGTFWIDLDKDDLPPGQYTVPVTLTLDGNTVDPDIRAVPYEVR